METVQWTDSQSSLCPLSSVALIQTSDLALILNDCRGGGEGGGWVRSGIYAVRVCSSSKEFSFIPTYDPKSSGNYVMISNKHYFVSLIRKTTENAENGSKRIQINLQTMLNGPKNVK